jgi:superfamily II DNA/RNA helicase
VAEKKALQMGADIIVCTPGRMIAHINMNYVSFKGLQFLVLDEADRMLDMGFQDDINLIINQLPQKRQTLLFSATMPEKIKRLAQRILHQPEEIYIAISKPAEKIVQRAYVVYEEKKLLVVKHLLQTIPFKSALIFCSRKQSVKQLARELHRAKFVVGEIHSDLEQHEREDMLLGFGSQRIPVLVATDILSRGIDIDTIDLVINYDVPNDGEDYVHRIGRTARAEAEGIALTLIGEKEQNKFAAIESLLGKQVDKAVLPQELGEVPAYQPRVRTGNGGGKRRPNRGYHNRNNSGRKH